jgi:Ca2+-binding RTX toxin-like protein
MEDDPILGTDFADVLRGTDGDDYISGLGGNDLLIGGLGTDSLIGGPGDDTFKIELGDGNHILFVGDLDDFDQDPGFDQIRFGEGISPEDIIVTRNGDSLFLTNGVTDEITAVLAHYFDEKFQIGRVVFADGTIWYPWKIDRLLIAPTQGDDQISVMTGFMVAQETTD